MVRLQNIHFYKALTSPTVGSKKTFIYSYNVYRTDGF